MVTGNQAVGDQHVGRLKFLDNGLKTIPAADEKVRRGVKEIFALLEDYRDALTS